MTFYVNPNDNGTPGALANLGSGTMTITDCTGYTQHGQMIADGYIDWKERLGTGTINVTGGSFTCTTMGGRGVYSVGNGTINITDATFNTAGNESHGVYVLGKATVNIKNANIDTQHTDPNNGGMSGYAVLISNMAQPYEGKGNVTIDGGYYKGYVSTDSYGTAIQVVCIDSGCTGSINIISGLFNAEPKVIAYGNTRADVIDSSSTVVTNDNTNYPYKVVSPTYVAQIGDVKYETLAAAVAAAQSGDTIKLLVDLTDTGASSLKAGVTLDGDNHTVSGNSCVYINAAGGTVKNLKFENIHNSNSSLSAVYSSKLTGTATISNCTFSNCDWDAIQITPLSDDAVVNITNNVFEHNNTEIGQKRFVHIEGTNNGSTSFHPYTVKMNENVFNAADVSACVIVYWKDASKLDLSNNYFVRDILTVRYYAKDENYISSRFDGAYKANPQYTALNEDGSIDTSSLINFEAYVIKAADNYYPANYYKTFAEALEAAEVGQYIYVFDGVNTTITSGNKALVSLGTGTKANYYKVSEAVAAVTDGSTTTKCASLADAIAAANDGDTVKLLTDVTTTEIVAITK